MSIQFNSSFIIPAIDIINGQCVRLTKGDFNQKIVYDNDPVKIAQSFEASGIKRVHIVDLDGAKSGSMKNFSVLEKIAKSTSLEIDYGGGVQSIEDVQNILDAGAKMVTIGSLAVRKPEIIEEWILEFGTDHFLIGIDVLNNQVKIAGWQESTQLNVFHFIAQTIALGATKIFCTDIERDGMMQGPSIKLYKEILIEHPELEFIASGGVTTIDDLSELKNMGCAGVIIGKSLYEGNLKLSEILIEN